jgi:hypothetical protein
MTNTQLTPINVWTSKIGKGMLVPVVNTREGKHGGSAWSVPFSDQNLRQPQDGAADRRRRLAMIDSHLHSNLLNEPEDARLTGGTRSLTRRLLGLNIMTVSRKTAAAVTGSITRTEVA